MTPFGTLYLLPVPLLPGTAAAVLSPQVLDTARGLTHFLAENVRTARRHLSDWALGRPIEALHMAELSQRTPDADLPGLLAPLLNGVSVGVMSEAGCPGVADPGARAVAWAHAQGCPVVPLVGPSSLLLALMASGFSGQDFVFHGYLPIERGARQRAIQQLERTVQRTGQTQLFIETPYRNQALLATLLATCQPDTHLCIAADLTAPDALVRTLPIRQWRQQTPDLHKRPAIFLLGR